MVCWRVTRDLSIRQGRTALLQNEYTRPSNQHVVKSKKITNLPLRLSVHTMKFSFFVTDAAGDIESMVDDLKPSTPETERAATTDSDDAPVDADAEMAVQSLDDAADQGVEHQIPIEMEDGEDNPAPVDKPPTPMPE